MNSEMNEQERLLIQRQASRIGELEIWLALLVVRHGVKTETGWRYRLCDAHAAVSRAQLPSGHVGMSIDYDVEDGHHLLDVV